MDRIDPTKQAEPQPEAAEPGRGRAPLIATLIGSAIILLVLTQGRAAISDDLGERLAAALGLAAAPAILVGGVTYAIALRKAPVMWKVGSLATILLVSIFAGFVESSGWLARPDPDLAAADEQLRQIAKDPSAKVEPLEYAGPYHRMVTSLVTDVGRERRAFEQQMQLAGFNEVVRPEGLNPSSAILSRCDRFDSLETEAQSIGGRWPAQLAKARAIGAAAGMPEEKLRAFDHGYGKGDYSGNWQLNGEFMKTVGEMCRFLAGHKWQNDKGPTQFFRQADVDEFNRLAQRLETMQIELQRRVEEAAAAEHVAGTRTPL
jgi:hypothetical protein